MTRCAFDLREFITHLANCQELHRISARVESDLEIARITDRVSKASGPALLFAQPHPFSFPVLTNLFGSHRRTAWALGAGDGDLAPLAARLAARLAACGTGTLAERLERLCAAVPQRAAPPLWDEVAGELAELPAFRSWPGDGGRYLTLPLVVTRHPESGAVNWGLYRVQVRDDGTLLIPWKDGSGAAQHARAWRERGRAMPVAVVLGAPPAMIWAAAAPLPAGIDEAAFVGLLTGEPLPLARCSGLDLPVPASAEAVLEGTVAPGETGIEGPFGNHTGAYAPAGAAPLVRLNALFRRRDLLCPATIVGPPPMEDCFLAAATARLFLPLLRVDLPEVVDLAMPLEGIFHGCALVAAASNGEGLALLQRLRATALLRRSRMIVLFAPGVDVHNNAAAFWVAINAVDPRRDLRVGSCGLDIDASRFPAHPLRPDPATAARVAGRATEYGLPESWFD